MTEQQQNIEELNELNKRLQTVMEVAQMSLWTYDIKEDTIFTIASIAFLKSCLRAIMQVKGFL